MAGRDFATWLDSSTMTRISTSKLHGVGVMAIKRIEAGVDPFPGIKKRRPLVPMTIDEVMKLEPEVQRMVVDFCLPDVNGTYWVYRDGFTSMDLSFYVNHSQDPNLETVQVPGSTLCGFRTLRPIEVGEELTFCYGVNVEFN